MEKMYIVFVENPGVSTSVFSVPAESYREARESVKAFYDKEWGWDAKLRICARQMGSKVRFLKQIFQ